MRNAVDAAEGTGHRECLVTLIISACGQGSGVPGGLCSQFAARSLSPEKALASSLGERAKAPREGHRPRVCG